MICKKNEDNSWVLHSPLNKRYRNGKTEKRGEKKRQPEGASTAVSVSRDLLPLNEYEMNIFVIKESHGPAVVGVVEFFIPD